MEERADPIRCPGCGQEFLPDAATSLPDGTFRCPACKKEFLPRKAPAGAPPTAVTAAPAAEVELLPICPICEDGRVVRSGSSEEEELFACRTCDSVLSETIFGFRYKRIDARFEKRKEEFEGQTFTRVDLLAMADKLVQARQARDKKAVPSGEARRPAEAAREELWWELDREELARRRKAEPKAPPKKDITVDDLLDELKKP